MITKIKTPEEELCRWFKRDGDSCTKYPESDMMCAYIDGEQHRCNWFYNPDYKKKLTPL